MAGAAGWEKEQKSQPFTTALPTTSPGPSFSSTPSQAPSLFSAAGWGVQHQSGKGVERSARKGPWIPLKWWQQQKLLWNASSSNTSTSEPKSFSYSSSHDIYYLLPWWILTTNLPVQVLGSSREGEKSEQQLTARFCCVACHPFTFSPSHSNSMCSVHFLLIKSFIWYCLTGSSSIELFAA